MASLHPTLLMWRNGHEVARQVGALPAVQLEGWVTDHLDAPVVPDPQGRR